MDTYEISFILKTKIKRQLIKTSASSKCRDKEEYDTLHISMHTSVQTKLFLRFCITQTLFLTNLFLQLRIG